MRTDWIQSVSRIDVFDLTSGLRGIRKLSGFAPAFLDGLFPEHVRFAVMCPADADLRMLFPEEQASIENAVPVRQNEYAAVRQIAKTLLPEFGHAPSAIINDDHRSPVFPHGVIGSFSHSRDWAIAAMASSSDFRAIGCDVEPQVKLPAKVVRAVLMPEEQIQIADGPIWADRLIFSVKEAVYKAQFALSVCILDFHDLEVEVDFDLSRFSAKLRKAVNPFGSDYTFCGHFRLGGSSIWTAITIPPET